MRGVKEAEQILNKETIYKFSPTAALEETGSSKIPIYLARAGKDKPDLNRGIDKFIEVALSNNVPIDLSNHEHGRHAFDILDNTFRSKEIIKRTLEFVRFNLNVGQRNH